MIEFKAQKKYIVACVTAALLAPCITTFAVDEDLHNRLSNVKSQMQVQAQRSQQAQAVIGDVFAKLKTIQDQLAAAETCLLYTSPSPRDKRQSRMPSSA